MSLTCLKKIQICKDGSFTGWTTDGLFTVSTKTIVDVLYLAGDALKAPWMTRQQAIAQAADCYNVDVKFDQKGNITAVSSRSDK